MNLATFPHCAERLKFQRVKLDDPAMTDYWAAVNVASDLSDTALGNFGGFDFTDMSPRNGKKLLERLEAYITRPRATRKAKAVRESLKAFMGSQGIKTGLLKLDAQYWIIAAMLWPDRIVRRPDDDLGDLHKQIHSIGKKERSALARANLGNVPEFFVSELKLAAIGAAQ